MKRTILLLSALAALFPASVSAQAGIRVIAVEEVRIDGAIRDWRDARFTAIGEGPDASMRFALGHDARGLYLAAEVWDERMVRTPRPGAREDAVILTLKSGRRPPTDVYFFAGVPGRAAASVGIGRPGSQRVRPVRGAQIVEGPLARGHGYTLEAFVPFSAIPGGAGWREARGTVRLRDVDSEARPEVESEPALVPLDALVPFRPAGGAAGALEEFLASRNLLAARPTHELHGDVAGDARAETVTLVAGYLLVSGPGFREDGGYAYHQLGVESGRDVRSAELVDLTGDGKAELVVVLRQRNAQGERDLWQALELSGRAPRPLLGVEVRKASGNQSVESQVRVRRVRGAPPLIEVRAGRARGFDASNYRESPASGVEAMLLPWGPVRARSYRWTGRAFEQVGEEMNTRYRPPQPVETPTRAPSRGAASPRRSVATPSRPSTEAVLAAARRERGVAPNARPTHRLRANFAGSPEPETGLVFGRKVILVGPGMRDGASWLYYEIPASSDRDVLSVQAADVTGDQRAELLVRVRQTFGAVTREVLLVHQVTDSGFPRLLQVEVARAEGGRSIQNRVTTGGGRLQIAPGRAQGWTESTYHFTRDPNDSVEPLLLPWRDRPLVYRLRGGRLSAGR